MRKQGRQTGGTTMIRRVIAAILDFFTVFVGGGIAIAWATGNLQQGGFKLEGSTALVLFALIAVYFFACPRFLGGTLWQHILRTRR
jgi:hypothetical protein